MVSLVPVSSNGSHLLTRFFPNELLFNIISLSDDPGSPIAFLQTCERFYKLFSSSEANLLWKKLLERNFPDSSRYAFKVFRDSECQNNTLSLRYYQYCLRIWNNIINNHYQSQKVFNNYKISQETSARTEHVSSSYFAKQGIYSENTDRIKIVNPTTKESYTVEYPEGSHSINRVLNDNNKYLFICSAIQQEDGNQCTIQIVNLKTKKIESKEVHVQQF